MSRTIVIGGGVVGLCCAYELRRRGEMVTILDRDRPGCAASSGNTGWIVPSFSGPVPGPGVMAQSLRWMLKPDSPLYIRPHADPGFIGWVWTFWRHCNTRAYASGLDAVAALNTRTTALFDALAADGVEFEMHNQGVLFAFLGKTALDHVRADLDRMRRYGYGESTALSADETRDLEPMLTGAVIGGILAAQERHVRPETLTDGLVQRLGALGVEIRPGVAVTGLRRRGAVITAVETPEGPVAADRFLVAAGVWSGAVTRYAGVRLPLEAGKGYSVTLTAPAAQVARPLYLDEARVAVSNFRDALRFAGTMELSGISDALDARRIAAMKRGASRYLRTWPEAAREETWMGMRPLTPDGLPVIGRIPGCENLYVATGHAMLGVTLAPATAVGLAEAMLTARSSIDLRPFDPARFARHDRPQ